MSKTDWNRFSHDQCVYSSEEKEGTEQELTEQEREGKINIFQKEIEKHKKILNTLIDCMNKNTTAPKTKERIKKRINEIQQRIDSINKEIKATRNTNEQKNIDKKES